MKAAGLPNNRSYGICTLPTEQHDGDNTDSEENVLDLRSRMWYNDESKLRYYTSVFVLLAEPAPFLTFVVGPLGLLVLIRLFSDECRAHSI